MSNAIKKLAASELPKLGKDFREAVESNQVGVKVLHELVGIHSEARGHSAALGNISPA